VINAFGGALSAGEINPGMLCAGRFFAGFGLGLILPGTPLYQAEIAPPHSRGLVVGLHASLLGGGMTFAQWMGVAFFHARGQVSWRTPMALSCVWPTILAVVVWFLPESPRWLYLNGRADQAQEVLIKLHHNQADVDHTFARNEFHLMKAQIDLEAEETQHISSIWKNRHLLKRFVVGWVAMSGTQASGSIIILSKPRPALLAAADSSSCAVVGHELTPFSILLRHLRGFGILVLCDRYYDGYLDDCSVDRELPGWLAQ
jgi:MFS family permease